MRIISAIFFNLLILLVPKTTNGQWVIIPDPNFVSYLNTIVPGCISGNQLDTTCSLVTNLNSINCTNQNISSLDGIQYFDNLNYLKCSSNNITSINSLPFSLDTLICEFNNTINLGPLPPGLKYLNCAHNDLFSLPVLPSTLYYLNCKTNQLTSLPALPNGLTFMDCSMNDISVLPALPSTLGYLNCSTNMISSLGNLPGNLYYLAAAYLQLTSLPVLPASLTSLFVQSNQLTAIPPLPSQLNYFTCNENLLTSLPTLPSTLFDFRCEFNSITSLPALPNGLRKLYCQDNDLTSLPALPDSLWELVCGLNQLSVLPNLPAVLKYIQCSGNQLTTLPPIPESVLFIMAYDNQLTSLPSLPDTLAALYIQNNPTLNCLPELPSCQAILFYNTGVQCLPNYPVVGFSNPQINSLPLCDIFNVNSCDFYYNISGTVFSDANTNCLNDFTEAGLPGIKLNLTQGASVVQQNYSTQGGLYTFKTLFGVYDYFPDTSGVPYITICPVSGVQTSIININDSIDNGMDFGLICKAGIDLGTSSINRTSGMFFPGNSANLQCISGDLARLYSLICANGISGTVTVNFTGPVQFSTYPPGSLSPTVSPNTLTYSISDFGSVDIFSAFRFSLITDISAQAGQQVCITVTVSPSNNDLYPVNNIYTHCFTVVNSYDPNIKEANPIGFTTPDNWITYTIHFQNTGTAPAQHIVITDTLDADLQEGTFAFLASSHQPFVNVTDNVIKFTFPNINLPDSTSDEPGSHGWAQYKVKSDPGLALGTTIENTANIYFDFNPPVITNTTVNTVVLPTSIQEADDFTFNLSPNPAAFETNIRTLVNGDYRILVIDMTGRTIYQDWFKGNTFPLQVENWPKGLFVVELQDSQGNISRRPLMTGN